MKDGEEISPHGSSSNSSDKSQSTKQIKTNKIKNIKNKIITTIISEDTAVYLYILFLTVIMVMVFFYDVSFL